MNRLLLLLFVGMLCVQTNNAQKIIGRQGQVSFFSYTSVENIKAQNNQVSSIIDLTNSKIAVSMLMSAFVFEKALMREHFNESYIETDIYPKATFEGEILDFVPNADEPQVRIIKGVFTMHGVSEQLEIKTKIEPKGDYLILSGSFETLVESYNINIPPLLAGNIAKTITVDFNIEHEPYVEN
ncbi:YceI family protein [Flagellimonas marina]|uniref:YceI family protein n=1 Tax=Flagellimonas marina TaxID=1775168 RepID=A0ABV8PFF6_9FLAO